MQNREEPVQEPSAGASAPHALVFGASGQIGRRVCALLLERGWRVTGVGRGPGGPAVPGLAWCSATLPAAPAMPRDCDAILSCGPLDLFSQWYAATGTGAARVVAFGSTSLHVKGDSPDPEERDLVQRLREGERTVFECASARAAAATLLRPTLVYGAGSDRNLSRVAALARRHGLFILPGDARGLRQPVHVDDLAAAAIAALEAPQASGKAYDLPGGETLPYVEMIARTLACLRPPARLLRLPGPLFGIVLALARRFGLRGAGAGVLGRLRGDLVFDVSPALRDLGYAPRPFRPVPEMFEPR